VALVGLALILTACVAKPTKQVSPPPVSSPARKAPGAWTVAIFPFEDQGFEHPGAVDGLSQTLADRISERFSDAPGLQLLDREAIEQVLEELSLSSRGLSEAEGRLEVGRLLGAGYLLVGSYTVIGGELRIDGRAIKVAQGTVLKSQAVSGPTSERKALEAALAERLFEALASEIGAKAGSFPQKPLISSQDHLRRGRFYEQQNEMEKALKHYQQALFLDEENREAKNRMERLLLKELE